MDEFVRAAVAQIESADAIAARSSTAYRNGTFQSYLDEMLAESLARLGGNDGSATETGPATGSGDGE